MLCSRETHLLVLRSSLRISVISILYEKRNNGDIFSQKSMQAADKKLIINTLGHKKQSGRSG